MKWQEVEVECRKIAESVWGQPANPERIAGVNCDAVVKFKNNFWILIEVSKQDDLAKLRDDISKLAVMRQSLMSNGTFSECYFITSGSHPSLVETGKSCNVEVHSLHSFASKFIGSERYLQERARSPFGSAVHPDTGDIDGNAYSSIDYVSTAGKNYSVSEVAMAISQGRKVILMGEFGTGKSRCLMEVFRNLSQDNPTFPPVAINLRDNWGYKKFHHIVGNHLESLGLGDFNQTLVRSLRRGNHSILLDGFDEIGSQSWSGDAKRLTEIRKRSLAGVRDLILGAPTSGILITGREHYFSSLDEMAECLGIDLGNALVLKCPEEFSEHQLQNYIKSNTSLGSVPEWMPRKPLICQLLARLPPNEVARLEQAANGELEFFQAVFDAICTRETKINPAIVKDTLKNILLELAQHTRRLPESDEIISTDEINQAFFSVTGYAPIDESSILLQRLPYLGRTGTGGSDRMFIDSYAKDGLRGIALSKSIQTSDKSIAHQKWQQPLHELGLRMLSMISGESQSFEKHARFCANHGNSQVSCDYIASKLLSAGDTCDLQGFEVNDGKISILSFADTEVKNLTVIGVEIGDLVIESFTSSSTKIQDCTIDVLKGVSSIDKLPDIFPGCVIAKVDATINSARISELKHSNPQKTLLALIKKLFFQPGAGRREEALLRGTERYWDRVAAEQTLRYMESNGIIFRAKGDHGTLYLPKRKHARRMANVMEMQSSSGDALWNLVS